MLPECSVNEGLHVGIGHDIQELSEPRIERELASSPSPRIEPVGGKSTSKTGLSDDGASLVVREDMMDDNLARQPPVPPLFHLQFVLVGGNQLDNLGELVQHKGVTVVGIVDFLGCDGGVSSIVGLGTWFLVLQRHVGPLPETELTVEGTLLFVGLKGTGSLLVEGVREVTPSRTVLLHVSFLLHQLCLQCWSEGRQFQPHGLDLVHARVRVVELGGLVRLARLEAFLHCHKVVVVAIGGDIHAEVLPEVVMHSCLGSLGGLGPLIG